MDSKKCNKIRDIVRLQQVLKKWRKQAACNSDNTKEISKTSSNNNNNNGIKFLKKTLSFSDQYHQDHEAAAVPRGRLAVCVGKEEEEEKKRFVIPMHYLRHGLFVMLLREAEEEFGFQNEGVLRIPCTVVVFEKVLRSIEREDSSCNRRTSGSEELSYDQHYCYCDQMCS